MKEESLYLLRTLVLDYLSKIEDDYIPKKDILEMMEDIYYVFDPKEYKNNKKKLYLKKINNMI